MPVFQVRHGGSSAVLWTGSAMNETQALDAMAHEAGYYDESDLPDHVRRGGLIVEALSFGQPRATADRSGGRVTGGRAIGQTAEHGRVRIMPQPRQKTGGNR